MHDLLQQYFGYDQFKPGQLEVMDCLNRGESALAIFPTGGGKSLCYQLPALTFDGLTLVISPLLALMKDQVDSLTQRGLPAARLDSTLSAEEVRAVYDQMRAGTLKLLYVAPERLNNRAFRAQLSHCQIAMLAVDEAHCISEWGHNFRPDYMKIAEFAQKARIPRILGLTATATPQVAEDICRQFKISDQNAICTGFFRPELYLNVNRQPNRLKQLIKRRKSLKPGAAIVYVTLQHTAEEVATALNEAGIEARHYHAGMKPEEREEIQEWFMATQTGTVVATIAFGMGVDKSDIRYVFHYNLPKSLENYQQEIGRAARDGQPAFCEILADPNDLITLKNFVYGDTPEDWSIRQFLAEIFNGAPQFDLSIYHSAQTYDLRQLVLNTLLVYLELEGYLQAQTPFFDQFKIEFLEPQEAILGRFDANRRTFLETMFSHGKMGRTWLTLETTPTAAAMDQPRDRLTTAINYLEEQNLIKTQVSGVRSVYRVLRQPENLTALADEMIRRFSERESSEIGRIDRIMDLIDHQNCYSRYLVDYFGDQQAPEKCQRCSNCRGTTEQSPAPKSPNLADFPDLAGILGQIDELPPEALSTPRQKARFLCGISSPRTSRTRIEKKPLTRHRLFGVLQNLPFQQILNHLEEK